MHFTIIENLLIVLLAAIAASVVFRMLRLPPILGYLLAGAIVSPHVLGLLPHTDYIQHLAEFGVVLLMFTIGLEFSLSQLIALRHSVFILGGLQVTLSILITVLIGYFFDIALPELIVIGCIVSMSSTAIVIKQLSEQFEIYTKHGLNAVGILLFQDLAVIPILVLIAYLGGTEEDIALNTLLWSLFKGVLAIVFILAFGRWLLRPLFRLIASIRVIELFTLSVLFVAISSAWLTHIVGMSYALGAFLAGIMLSETEFRHQINTEIRPFRDVLLGLFFVSIGMLVNLKIWLDAWLWILLLLTALMVGKAILITLLCRLAKNDLASSTRTGLILSQGGEFGFAILTLALKDKIIPTEYGQVILAALLLSFVIAPILIRHNAKIANYLFPKSIKIRANEVCKNVKTATSDLSHHVIICGYGRIGQNISCFLNKINCPYIALDLDPEIIHNALLAGDKVAYGNVTQVDILKAAKINKAAALVISIGDTPTSTAILQMVRRKFPKLPTIVRCKDVSDYEQLREFNPTKVVAEVFEESMTLASHLLQQLNIPNEQVNKLLKHVRDKDYQLLNQVFPGSLPGEENQETALHKHLRPVQLYEGSKAICQTLNELPFQNIDVIAVRRGEEHIKPRTNTKLKTNDILVLFGSPTNLNEAEKILLG